MTGTFANGRTIVHKRDGLVDVAGPPDVCKTPSPAGPVPVPYVNAARTADLAQGARRTRIDGAPIALASSAIATSTGDEPGTAGGGVISSKIRGKLRWQSTSLDVKVEGKGVARFTDAVSHNGNTFNTSFFQRGTGWAYGDDFTGPCPICRRGPASHRVPETAESHGRARELYEALEAAYGEYAERDRQRQALAPEVDRLRADKRTFEDGLEESSSGPGPSSGPAEAGPSNSRPRHSKEQKKQLKEYDKRIKAVAGEMRSIEGEMGKTVVHKRTTDHGGYMIGVMVCKSNKVFAAMSGQTLAGFAKVVAELGWTLCDATSGVDDYIAANPKIADLDKRSTVHERWDDVQRRTDAREAHYNLPGMCAAAKLLTRNEQHIPRTMTEMFFAPRQAHQVQLHYRHYERFHPFRVALGYLTCGRFGPVDVERDVAFDPGTTVPSCLTCQTLLPLVLCDRKRRQCP
ncbi:DUF4150 domain-containing protein [Nannocystis punicea]|uniref:DUF4150 domain-containing protein n=1 Tax=Nannocystis punicea TaxID=2995304 RepID=A0ABY7HFH0_9BACT|nr:DUF4150 domain-containing protein [Nannocystis poenicansa]WAS98037.1 DUF4150 domain-containing protein [Nannocystis poenicansa]